MTIKKFDGILPIYDKTVFIDESAVLAGDIKIGKDSSVWPIVAARGDVNKIRIGERTNIQDGSVLHVSRPSQLNPEGYPLIIGDDVTVGHKCMLHGCRIGDNVLVGMGAIVLDGAIIESEVFIAAGSLVPPRKRLESGYLYVGNPVEQKRPLKDKELAFFKDTAANYVMLKNKYMENI